MSQDQDQCSCKFSHSTKCRLSRETTFLQGSNSLKTISQPPLINPNIAKALLKHFSQSQTQRLYYTFHLKPDIKALLTYRYRFNQRVGLQFYIHVLNFDLRNFNNLQSPYVTIIKEDSFLQPLCDLLGSSVMCLIPLVLSLSFWKNNHLILGQDLILLCQKSIL